MNKLLLYLLFIGLFMSLFALQADEEMSMSQLFDVKHALNRATHAAAQETDLIRLSHGIADLDADRARSTAVWYLRENLRLDGQLAPVSGSYLQAPVKLLACEVIGADSSFPYTYHNDAYAYTVTLNRPGVIMIIKLQYPRMYGVMDPVVWVVKSASELVM